MTARRAGEDGEAPGGRRGNMFNYDYLLIAGPGRSGTELLYLNMSRHPDLRFPEAKEGGYYRRPARIPRASRGAGILTDISNLAYNDAALAEGVSAARRAGRRVLIVITLREHRDRAVSMIRFRKSRGEFSAWFGDARLERSVIRDRLTRADLEAIYDLEADILAIRFDSLIENPKRALNAIAGLCGVPPFGEVEGGLVNESLRPRFFPLSAAAKLMALTMRRIGLRKPLQRIKDSDIPRKVLFAPITESEKRETAILQESSARLLERSYKECMEMIERRSERVDEGVFVRRV